jgi:putative membrane protein
VPYIVGRADDGEAEAWQGAALGALAAVLLAALWRGLGPWGAGSLAWVAVPAWLGVVLGFLAGAHLAPVARLLAGAEQLDRRARARARIAFLEEGVFATAGRTGVLVFLAVRERRAVILADDGIAVAVGESEWQAIVDQLTAAASAGRIADGMAEAVRACGALVAERSGPPGTADANELHDDPRVRPE